MLKIDSHTHLLPKSIPNWTRKFGYGDFISLKHHRPGFANMMRGRKFFREIEENCWNPELRIKEYKRHNTSVQVVCTVPVMFSYWAKPADGLEVSRFLNDDLAQVAANDPAHYVALGTLPMQDTRKAIQELERCKQLGMPGIQIGSNINDLNLHEDRFFPVFEACQELNMAILVHPWNMMGEANMTKYWLPWLVGMPAETTRAITSMIFGGVFERLPGLRVNFAHAGGSFLPTLGRIRHGFNCRPDLVAVDNKIDPARYLGKFWVDSITHDAEMLRYVISKVGSRRVTLGSDYPFPLGDLEIGRFIEEGKFTKREKEDIFVNSTLEWLNLSRKNFGS